MTRKLVAVALVLGSAVTIQAQQTGQGGAARGVGTKTPNLVFRRGPLESKVVTGQPYSADITSETIQTLSDGNRIVHRSTGRVYRDGQGRVRREDDQSSGTTTISITDPVANKTITLDTERKVAHESSGLQLLSFFYALGTTSTAFERYTLVSPYFRGLAAAGGRSRGTVAPGAAGGVRGGRGTGRETGAGAPVEETLSNRTIEGVPVTGIRRTTTIEKGAIGNEQPIKIVSEEWTSPDLQVLVLTEFNDPRAERSTYKLTKITRGEPDPALFKAPAGYRVTRTGAARGGRGRGM